jgi:mono/diheme cytochrome c family protein
MKNRLVIIIALLTIFLTACSFSLAEDITPPPNYVSPTPQPTLGVLYPTGSPSPARGKSIFEVNCAPCHGTDGLGNGPEAASLPVTIPAIGLQDIASQSNPASWYTVITQGRMDRDMPPFSMLSDAERWDVLSYVYSLSNTPGMVEQGAVLYGNFCATCHGPNGQGSGTPITGTPAKFTDPAFMSQTTGVGMYQAIADGVSPDMPGFNSKMSEKEIWSVTAYLRTLSYDKGAQVVEVASPTVQATNTLENTPLSSPSPSTTTETAQPITQSGTPVGTPVGTVTQSATKESSPTAEVTATPEALSASISGKVTNGSGGKAPTKLVITLHGFVDMNEKVTLTTNVKSDGTYDFTKVPLETNMAFIVSTEFEGTAYNSDVAVYDGSTTTFELPLTVYETTTDTSSISADRLHLFFDFSNTGLVQVIEIYILSNSSDKAVVPGGTDLSVQTYTLPEGATNLQFDSGEIGNPYLTTKDGFGDPTTILPGASSYQLIYAFDLPYGKSLEIKQPLNVSIGSVIVMAPEGIKVKSDQLKNEGLKDVQGSSYTMFTTSNLAPGDSITLAISGTPKTTSTSGTTNNTSQTSLAIGLGIFGAVLILAALFFFLRGRSHKADLESESDLGEEETDPLGDDPDSIMDAITSLDDQFKAGTIGEEAYQKRRTQLKAKLKDLL